MNQRTHALFKTIDLLERNGLEIDFNAEDRDIAAALVTAYAKDAEKTSDAFNTRRAAKMTPASLKLTHGLLQEFGQSVVESATHVRHLVTNKLLMETENPDPRIRIRALELLGKISDVGLFAEKTEVTITHQTSEELRARLRDKLNKVIEHDPESIEDADFIDIDKELGIDND